LVDAVGVMARLRGAQFRRLGEAKHLLLDLLTRAGAAESGHALATDVGTRVGEVSPDEGHSQAEPGQPDRPDELPERVPYLGPRVNHGADYEAPGGCHDRHSQPGSR